VTLTKISARPAPLASSVAQVEDLMAELRRLSLGSSGAWSDTELTLTQLRALATIQLHQPMTVGALSAALRMSLASGSALADRLVRAGLLERHRDPDDRRQVLLELAPSAVRFLRRIEEHSRARLRRAVAAIEPHEREALATALGAFVRVLREASGGAR
jgi:DNA-binding MarR family transcriptional regulator